MLNIRGVTTGYGKNKIIDELSMLVEEGKISSIVGPNGAGKSTLLKAISGILDIWDGKIKFRGREISDLSTEKRISEGLLICPQGGRVFPTLTVKKNLEVGNLELNYGEQRDRIDEVVTIFPGLIDRLPDLAYQLSGGQQQMLAIGRTLMRDPSLLLLDEPTLGLSPNSSSKVISTVEDIHESKNTDIIIVEQAVKEAVSISDTVFAMARGKKVFKADNNPKYERIRTSLEEIYV